MNHAKETKQTETSTKPPLEYFQKSDSQKAATSETNFERTHGSRKEAGKIGCGKTKG
jgi:hypothetical protein